MQFSLFGAEAVGPALSDLDGVLLAGGQWVRAGQRARLSVVVPDGWRVAELARSFTALGVGDDTDGTDLPAGGQGFGARTAFGPELAEAAARWTRGANQAPPGDFALGPGGLRLWAVAAGRLDANGLILGTPDEDGAIHRVAGAALSRLGLAAVSVTRRGGGPGWRLSSAKRLRRLAEIVGPAPVGAAGDWPGG